MANTLQIKVSPLITKGTPVPSSAVSPSTLRSARLPFSEGLARDIESLSTHVNKLHTLLANTAPVVSAIQLTNTVTGTSMPLADAFQDFTGDAGSGGTAGLVPAPAPGDAAAGKFLKADGAWEEVLAEGSGIALETNGVANTLQTTLNLLAGANIVLTPDAFGGVAIALASAVTATHGEPLTDGNSNFIFAAGDVIEVLGIPN